MTEKRPLNLRMSALSVSFLFYNYFFFSFVSYILLILSTWPLLPASNSARSRVCVFYATSISRVLEVAFLVSLFLCLSVFFHRSLETDGRTGGRWSSLFHRARSISHFLLRSSANNRRRRRRCSPLFVGDNNVGEDGQETDEPHTHRIRNTRNEWNLAARMPQKNNTHVSSTFGRGGLEFFFSFSPRFQRASPFLTSRVKIRL